jgi:hypothetical protein
MRSSNFSINGAQMDFMFLRESGLGSKKDRIRLLDLVPVRR